MASVSFLLGVGILGRFLQFLMLVLLADTTKSGKLKLVHTTSVLNRLPKTFGRLLKTFFFSDVNSALGAVLALTRHIN